MNLYDLMPERIKSKLQRKTYYKAETILFAGIENCYVYFLQTGKAAAYIPTKDGHFAQIYLYEAGSVFGELEQFYEGRQTVEIAAITPCTVERLHRADFFDWLKNDFESTKFFIKQISYKLLQNGEFIEEISVLSVRERLLRCIATHYRQGDLDSVAKDQIVKEVKAPLRSVNRAIAECSNRKIIQYESRKFAVLNEDKLLEFLKY